MNLSPTPVENLVDISRAPAANDRSGRQSRALVSRRTLRLIALILAYVIIVSAFVASMGVLFLLSLEDPL